ncbi:MAG TPA: Uma2 family endonuclease, partial [Thermoanaerobaculia bacterium]
LSGRATHAGALATRLGTTLSSKKARRSWERRSFVLWFRNPVGRQVRMNAIPSEQKIEYPTSDGQPMAETTLHRKVMCDLIEGLERHFSEVPDIWVGGNLFLCYEKGNPEACLAPDVLLAKGVEKWDRPNYLLWEETPPSLIMEVTSLKTRWEDQGKKRRLYERIGVEEYMVFDPYGEYLQPRLQGYRLHRKRYQPILSAEDETLLSRTTNLLLRPEGLRLRMVDAVTGEQLPLHDEAWVALARASAARRAEAAARRSAEAAQRAAEAAQRAAEVAQRTAEAEAAEEAAARRSAEERVRALEAEIERLRKG